MFFNHLCFRCILSLSLFLTVPVSRWRAHVSGELTREIGSLSNQVNLKLGTGYLHEDKASCRVDDILSRIESRSRRPVETSERPAKRRKISKDFFHQERNYEPTATVSFHAENTPIDLNSPSKDMLMDIDRVPITHTQNVITFTSAQEAANWGKEFLNKELDRAFGTTPGILARIKDSGVFEVVQRFLNIFTHHDVLPDLCDEDERVLDEGLQEDRLPDDRTAEGRLFWDYLGVADRPQIPEDLEPSAKAFSLQLQIHQNDINRKLLAILTDKRSAPMDATKSSVLSISKTYMDYLDGIEKQLTVKPRSFIEVLDEQQKSG